MEAILKINGPVQSAVLDREEILHRNRRYWIGRRAQDILLSSLALLALWPVMLVIAVLIRADSPGKAIFSQERVGRDGKKFKLYKFRSMVSDAEDRLDDLLRYNEMEGPAFKIREDPRITRVGRVLRRTSLDELPQLFNIIMGDMSIVGPRPPLPREVAEYNSYYMQRLYVTPGLTCYWQIRPNRNDCTFDEWVELDLKYIRERSFFTDWKIILKTFGVVLGMDGV